jgi:hypothetical protein
MRRVICGSSSVAAVAAMSMVPTPHRRRSVRSALYSAVIQIAAASAASAPATDIGGVDIAPAATKSSPALVSIAVAVDTPGSG